MDYRDEFPLDDALTYLNHAAVAPWPRRTHEAVVAFSAENLHQGARNYPRWLKTVSVLKDQLAELIHAESPDNIALVKNTSEGLSFVAGGLAWEAGDEIVISDEEFPSNRVVWQALASRGVVVREVPLREGSSPEDALLAACNERTRLLSISAVQYASGLRMDLARLGAGLQERGILYCVDAIQAVGAVPFDVQAIGADFAIADGHKWMLGPEGLGFMYVAPRAIDQLALTQYGWNMLEDAGNYDRKDWTPARSARRFEAGSPNMLSIHALSASVSLLLAVGADAILAAITERTRPIVAFAQTHAAYELVGDADPARLAGIVVLRRKDGQDAALFEALRDADIVCARRGGGIRLSPHFYTPQAHVQRALAFLDAWAPPKR